jgi:lipopolysaccharide export system protein LptC
MADVDVIGRTRRSTNPGARHTRIVAWLKWVLPMVAATLVLLVGTWPELQAGLLRLSTSIPRIDLRAARDLSMVNARYSGLDRNNRPFVLTADTARQSTAKDNLVSLEAPKADMSLENGAWVAVTALSGLYHTEPKTIDLFGDVNLFHDKGMTFRTESATVDLQAGTAEGQDHVQGHGPSGEVESEGFRILDKGDVVIFTGRANMVLEGAAEQTN